MCWDDDTQNHPQTLTDLAVPLGRNVGTVDDPTLPSRPAISLGWDDGTLLETEKGELHQGLFILN